MAFKDWSTTAADNDDADAGINWAEGQAPSTVNGSSREMMAVLKKAIGHIISVKDYGAVGDDSTDDTIAIQAAITAAAGGTAFFPEGVYKITDALSVSSNTVIKGDGWGSRISISASSTANIFQAVSKDRVIIEDVHMYAGGARSSGADGCGVYLQSCTKSAVRNCFIENPGSSAIQFYNTDDSKIEGNTVLAGAVGVPVQEVDIYLRAGCNRNIIRGNHCIASGDSGIAIQTVTNGDVANDNIIMGNIVDSYARYGVYLYRQNSGDSVLRNKIIGNSIRNITGDASDDGGVTKPFGSGIYVQGTEYSVISQNTIDTVNTNTNDLTLAPGAIGTSGANNLIINGNLCRNSVKEGITVRDPSGLGAALGFTIISNNVVVSTTRTAIEVQERGRVKIIGNTVDTASQGIRIPNTTAQDPFVDVIGNQVRLVSSSGIDVNFVLGVNITGNTVRQHSATGINVANCSQVVVSGNNVANGSLAAGTTGILIASTVSDGCVIDGNLCTDNEFGMILNAQCMLGDNRVVGNTTEYTGNFKPSRTLPVNDTTPSVLDGKMFVTANSAPTAISMLDDGVDGQEVHIVIRDANTTVDFSGTQLSGNAGSDWSPAANDSMVCVYDKTLNRWFCNISDN